MADPSHGTSALSRRSFVGAASVALPAAMGLEAKASEPVVSLPFANGERPLVVYPQKRPLLRLTTRPPQLETPFEVFDQGVITPNDAFFVRYHLAGVPFDDLDARTHKIAVGGHVERPLTLSLADLRKLPKAELIAVNQCSGNSRGFFEPRVAGGQAGNGMMGAARWTGARLKDVLALAKARPGALNVQFTGADRPVDPATPVFSKALDMAHALEDDVILAYAMNGKELPLLNGYPVRLVAPGYYGTYWVKHLTEITVLDHVLDNFWMSTAYRIPDNDCNCVPAGAKPDKTRPIGRFNVRSFITSPLDSQTVPASRPLKLRGIAFDGGSGIGEVAVSIDGGATWTPTQLGPDLGRYAFRSWTTSLNLPRGAHRISVRATSIAGETQPLTAVWNPSGYMRNVVETIRVEVA